jgi:hypothetical protein|tara:strand:- start:19 stop:258 length:240 start_codon:yes stop_codon:yes gene_type:complete
MSLGMAKNSETDAASIASQFRSIVEAEDQALLGIMSTFAEQDFVTQLGWFTDQIEARFKKNTPSPDTRCEVIKSRRWEF